jgi:hypothetical protein
MALRQSASSAFNLMIFMFVLLRCPNMARNRAAVFAATQTAERFDRSP